MNEFVSTGYLYSMWNGVFTVYKGTLHQSLPKKYHHFICENIMKHFTCSSCEGEIYNAMLWFSERKDDKAKEKLLKYEETIINELQQRIENHQRKMILLSEPLVEK